MYLMIKLLRCHYKRVDFRILRIKVTMILGVVSSRVRIMMWNRRISRNWKSISGYRRNTSKIHPKNCHPSGQWVRIKGNSTVWIVERVCKILEFRRILLVKNNNKSKLMESCWFLNIFNLALKVSQMITTTISTNKNIKNVK